jgi:hypothetical protein
MAAKLLIESSGGSDSKRHSAEPFAQQSWCSLATEAMKSFCCCGTSLKGGEGPQLSWNNAEHDKYCQGGRVAELAGMTYHRMEETQWKKKNTNNKIN